jgi:hypothetical protein
MPYSRDASIKKIQDLGSIVSQEKFASVVADLSEAEQTRNSSLLESAKKEGKTFLTKQGVTLPQEATAEITQNSPVTVCLGLGLVEICVTVK